MTDPDVILILTVGGSHQPLLTAIRANKPAYVCFVCSERDPGTGRSGSDTQVIGEGSVIKANSKDAKPSLPNIPTQAGLKSEQFEVVHVIADDLDQAFKVLLALFAELRLRFLNHRLIADYTGGTKSMSTALVLAALESYGVQLQLVTGNRADLIKVWDGTQYSAVAPSDHIRLHRAMAPYLASWQRFAYDEAAIGLAGITMPADMRLRGRLSRARDLSRAFAAWDRFCHAEAKTLLHSYEAIIGRELGNYLEALHYLTGDSDKNEPARLFDLWRNAERRAAQGRYDDGISRIYRLLEWSAQWLLQTHCGIDCSDVHPKTIPADMKLWVGRDGKFKATLFNAWELVGKLMDGPAAEFIHDHQQSLFGLLKVRNQSILAHGFTPITATQWDTLHSWCKRRLIPVLKVEAGFKTLPAQLPADYLWKGE